MREDLVSISVLHAAFSRGHVFAIVRLDVAMLRESQFRWASAEVAHPLAAPTAYAT